MKLHRVARALMGALLILGVPVLALVTTASAVTSSNQGLPHAYGRLGIWAGRWTFTGQLFETRYSQAQKESGTNDCFWMPSRGYMVCNIMGNRSNRTTNDLSIFSCSPTTGAYSHIITVNASDPLWESVTVHGNTWLAQAQISDKGKVILLRDLYTFLSPNRVTERVTVSGDQGRHWRTRWQGTDVKVH